MVWLKVNSQENDVVKKVSIESKMKTMEGKIEIWIQMKMCL